MSLSSLPEIFCVELLLVWCEVDSLVELDICSKKYRSFLKTIFASPHFHLSIVNCTNNRTIKWISSRNIGFKTLTFAGKLSLDGLICVSNINTSNIESIDFDQYQWEGKVEEWKVFVEVINKSFNLNSLKVPDIKRNFSGVVHQLDQVILRQLKILDLRFKSWYENTEDPLYQQSFIIIGSTCRNLTSLSLSCEEAEIKSLCNIISNNPHLTQLTLEENTLVPDELFLSIADNCPYMMQIVLNDVSKVKITTTALLNIFNNCTALETFNIKNKWRDDMNLIKYESFQYNYAPVNSSLAITCTTENKQNAFFLPVDCLREILKRHNSDTKNVKLELYHTFPYSVSQMLVGVDNITSLKICNSADLTNDDIMLILSNNSNLKLLAMYGCAAIEYNRMFLRKHELGLHVMIDYLKYW